jgi:hypothetical protein
MDMLNKMMYETIEITPDMMHNYYLHNDDVENKYMKNNKNMYINLYTNRNYGTIFVYLCIIILYLLLAF